MGIRSKPAYASHPPKYGWEDIVSIINPVKGHATCVGWAPSCGRRCWTRIAAHNVSDAATTLQGMRGFDDTTSWKLQCVADDMLCRRHGDQQKDMVRKWIQEGTETFNSQYYADRVDDAFERLMRLFAEYERRQRRSTHRPCEEETRWQDSHRARQHHQDTKASSNTEQPNAKPSRQYKKESPKPEDPRTQSKHQSKPYSDRRQSAPPPPEEKKQRKSQAWSDIWAEYICDWKCLDSDPQDKDVKIPWPTKSGLLDDVNEANIRLFFLEGLPVELQSGKERYDMMSVEAKRWHTDKIASRFGLEVMVGQHKEALNTVARVVVELWKEARLQRSRL